VFVAIALLILVSAAIPAQLQGRSVAIAIGPGSENTSESIDRTVADATSVYVRWLGMSSQIAAEDFPPAEPTRRDLSRIGPESDFVLVEIWTVAAAQDSAIELQATIYESSSATPLARRTGTVRMDRSAERDVVELLQELFDEATTVLVDSGSKLVDWGIDGRPPVVTETNPVQADLPRRSPGFLELGIAYAPVFAVADTTRFYRFGHGGGSYAGLVLGRRSAVVLGVAGSAFITSASGLAADGDLLVVPLGATVRIRSNPSPVGAFAAIGAGGALVRLTNQYLGTFSKVVPFASAGFGLSVAISSWFGLNAGVSMDAVFEGSTILTEFVPAVSVYMGF